MPSFGILCAAMFRFERERVLHCSLYCGTAATYPVSACSAVRWLHSGSRALRNDGSTPGPLPLICPSQRILNSCSALIKYRRVQTSLRRIIIRSESCWLNNLCAYVCHCRFIDHRRIRISDSKQLLFQKIITHIVHTSCLTLRKSNLCMPSQSQDTGASGRTM